MRRYTEEEDNFILNNIQYGCEYVAQQLNKTKVAIENRRRKLKLKGHKLKPYINRWSNDDIKFLKENYSTYGEKYCSEYLKKSIFSIRSKCRNLHIKRNKNILYNYIDDEHKQCTNCKKILTLENFSKHPNGKLYRISTCKLCRNNIRIKNKLKDPIKYSIQTSFDRAKNRAKKKNLEFSININDIIIPKYCPVFGLELIPNSGDNSPTIDRVDNKQGYTKDNICIISMKANRIKNEGTIDDFEKIISYMKNHLIGTTFTTC